MRVFGLMTNPAKNMTRQVDANGMPTAKLAGDSLTACVKIGSTATTIEEAKADPKVCTLAYTAVAAASNFRRDGVFGARGRVDLWFCRRPTPIYSIYSIYVRPGMPSSCYLDLDVLVCRDFF